MRIIFLLLLGVLSGCSLLPSAPISVARPAQVETVPFVVNGRIAINYQGKRHSAGLRWAHEAESDEILLLAPLGKVVARAYRDAQQATLDEGEKHYQAAEVETLMQQILGWHLPLDGLHHWLLGLAARGSEAQIERDARGRLSVLRQNDWEVRYLAYADDTPESLPKRVSLRHDSLEVQLLIDEWAL